MKHRKIKTRLVVDFIMEASLIVNFIFKFLFVPIEMCRPQKLQGKM